MIPLPSTKKHKFLAPLSLLNFVYSSAASMSSNTSVAAPAASCNAVFNNPAHQIGLGTYLMEKSQVRSAIRSALEIGYRRIDTAPVYFNEDAVGDALLEAIQEGIVSRQDLFIVSKLPCPMHRHVELAVKKTLSDLRLEYLDLYLIHWPVAFYYKEGMVQFDKRGYDNEDIDDSANGSRIDPTVSIHETWASMQELVRKGLVRHIGVSNFPVMLLHELLSQGKEPLPVINQCEAHPYLQNTKLMAYCNHRNIHFQAYIPLGASPSSEESVLLLQDAAIINLASKYKATPAQICIAWALQRGTSIVVKSTLVEHQQDNWNASKLTLEDEDMEAIARLNYNYRFFRPEEWWAAAAMAVFN
ncbi:hypothetical protein MPSEU_000998800 [Mayamaea pseudoterrestris]|nr:hypothetical protein MPSEU_000998800 [Mayamaea pseudoterrestris]